MKTDDYILIKTRKIPAQNRDIDQRKLRFWSDNPRVYSLLDRTGEDPGQDTILERMLQLDHVKELKGDIEKNGGLIDPLIVRDGDMVVLEGNSRLAAYRALEQAQPGRWTHIRCRVLPENLDDAAVYAMLGQYHVKGKKDWAPYEKAGFVYRRHKGQNVDLSVIADELGISSQAVRHMVDVFQFMLDNEDDNRERWSHYDEYLKNRKIKAAREEIASFDTTVVGMIKAGKIRAVDVRDQLPLVCRTPKVLKKFANGKIDLEDAFDDAKHSGADSVELGKVKRFRNWLVTDEAVDEILDHNRNVRLKIDYELKNLEQRIKAVRKRLEEESSRLDDDA